MTDTIKLLTMPKWGLTMERGTLVAWHKQVGEVIGAGDEYCDVETEKIANVVESPVSGILRRQVAAVGDQLPIGAILGVLADADVSDEQIDAVIAEHALHLESEDAQDGAKASEPETVVIDGKRVRHLLLEGAGSTIVFVHGFGGNLENWLLNQAAMAEAGHTVAALDLPGHGGSYKDIESGSLDELAGCLLAYLDHAGIEAAHFLGHSMGGAVCMQLAAMAPDRVQSLALVAGAGLGQTVDADYVESFIAATSRKDLKLVLTKLFADDSMVTRPLVIDTLNYKRLDGVDRALRLLADNALAVANQTDMLGAIDADLPVTVFWGEEDAVIAPPGEGFGQGSHVTLHRIEGAGHMAMVEAAGTINRLLAEAIA